MSVLRDESSAATQLPKSWMVLTAMASAEVMQMAMAAEMERSHLHVPATRMVMVAAKVSAHVLETRMATAGAKARDVAMRMAMAGATRRSCVVAKQMVMAEVTARWLCPEKQTETVAQTACSHVPATQKEMAAVNGHARDRMPQSARLPTWLLVGVARVPAPRLSARPVASLAGVEGTLNGRYDSSMALFYQRNSHVSACEIVLSESFPTKNKEAISYNLDRP